MVNQKAKEALDKIRADPKTDVYKVVLGKNGFDLAQKMLFVNPSEFDDPNESLKWASKWSNEEKEQAMMLIIGKTPQTKTKIGFKLLVGNGNNFAAVGELRPENEAFKRWKDYITK